MTEQKQEAISALKVFAGSPITIGVLVVMHVTNAAALLWIVHSYSLMRLGFVHYGALIYVGVSALVPLLYLDQLRIAHRSLLREAPPDDSDSDDAPPAQ